MSRKPRIHFPEAVYHIIFPGQEKKTPNNQRLITPNRDECRDRVLTVCIQVSP
jgi:hypothetical protein